MSDRHIFGFGINVADLDRSTDFYTGGLGLEELGKYDLDHMTEVLVGTEDEAVRILLVKYTSRTEPPELGTGFEKLVLECEDVAGVYEQAMAAGATSQLEPLTVEDMGLTVAMVRDPDGYLIELVKHA